MWFLARHICFPAIALGAITTAIACRGSAGNTSPSTSDSPVEQEVAKLVGNVLPPGHPGVVDVTFEIRADRDARPISPLIYGINHDLRDAANQRWSVIRNGGNRLTAYNWENNASNAGSDYLFQNDGLISASDEPAKPMLEMIDAATAIGAATIITISNADHVAADKNGNGDVRASGPDYLNTRFKRNHAKKPGALAPVPDAKDGDVYQDEFVNFLKAQRPNAKLLFSMDNEPELWAHTHAEIFSKPVTYADLWKRNHEFAKATKSVWPSAEVLGFVSYGYAGYQSLQNAPDANGRNFIEWYLDQAKAAEKSAGKRLIDYLDLHWYPEATGGGQRIIGNDTSPEVVAGREQAPRSLWDPKYKETSWISDAAGGAVDLIHWVKAKIDGHYPGTKLAFTEWNYGAGNHISGAIAVADVLGIFGRHGVDLATYFALSENEPYAYAAFRAFRNYDGQNGAFRDTSVAASSTDPNNATVYASLDRRDPSKVVIIAINKSTKARSAGVQIAHSSVYGTAKVYVLTGAQAGLSAGPTLTPVATNAFRYDMPAQSVSVIVPEPVN